MVILNSIVVAVAVKAPETKILSCVFPVSTLVVKVQTIGLTFRTDKHEGFPAEKIDWGEGLSGFHFGRNIWIFPSAPIGFVKASENFKASVTPTREVVEVKVTSKFPGVGVTVYVPLEESISTFAVVNVVILIACVVFAYKGFLMAATVKLIVNEVVLAANVIVSIFVALFKVQLVIPVEDIPVKGVQVLATSPVASLEKS